MITVNKELERLQKSIEDEVRRVGEIGHYLRELPEAAHNDIQPKVERLQVMGRALLRDMHELTDPGEGHHIKGGIEQVERLRDEFHREASNVLNELKTMSLGAPSSVTNGGDLLLGTIEKAAMKTRDLANSVIQAVRKNQD